MPQNKAKAAMEAEVMAAMEAVVMEVVVMEAAAMEVAVMEAVVMEAVAMAVVAMAEDADTGAAADMGEEEAAGVALLLKKLWPTCKKKPIAHK